MFSSINQQYWSPNEHEEAQFLALIATISLQFNRIFPGMKTFFKLVKWLANKANMFLNVSIDDMEWAYNNNTFFSDAAYEFRTFEK